MGRVISEETFLHRCFGVKNATEVFTLFEFISECIDPGSSQKAIISQLGVHLHAPDGSVDFPDSYASQFGLRVVYSSSA